MKNAASKHQPPPRASIESAASARCRLVRDSWGEFNGALDGDARPPRIVAIGGGTGLPTVLRGLMSCLKEGVSPEQLTALVTVTDDGGSSGQLRRELGVLPSGDVRNCLVALADPKSLLVRLLQHRFSSGDGLRNHPVGTFCSPASQR